MGHPIVTNGVLMHSCAAVCESIELLFGEVSGVGHSIGVLEGVHMPKGEGQFREVLAPFVSVA